MITDDMRQCLYALRAMGIYFAGSVLTINPPGTITLGGSSTITCNNTLAVTTIASISGGGLNLGSAAVVTWASTTDSGTGKDIALARLAIGVIRITNGSTGAGNLAITDSTGAIGTSGKNVLALGGPGAGGVAPSSSPADVCQSYVIDAAAGAAELQIRNEAGRTKQITGLDSFLAANYTNATATFSNVFTANVLNGKKYRFWVECVVNDSIVADGAQFDFNGGTATATNFEAFASILTTSGTLGVLTNPNPTALATAISIATIAAGNNMLLIQGTIEPSADGTFIMRSAQVAHTTGTLTINRGGCMTLNDCT